ERIFELYPAVDVAFGPGSIAHLGEWLGAGGYGVARGRFGLDDRAFAAELPMHNERSFQAWVQVSMGCNSKCSYCIVPAVRGREQSRRPGEILAEVQRLADHGVKELTLLGQNVNSWGRDLLPELETEFGELLRACDAVDGIERIGFTGETEADFGETLEVVEEVCYDSAFTFVYSPRAGTEAAAMPDQVPHELKIERMERLVEVVQRGARARNAERIGRVEEVLVEGPSRTDDSLLRGRTRRNT